MHLKPNKFSQLWREFKRRNVHRSLAIYAGTAFIILEAVDIIFPRWGLPDWSIDLILYFLIVGALVTLIVSWVYDISPKGIIKTGPEKPLVKEHKITNETNKLQRGSNIIIAVLIVIIGILLYPKIFKNDSSPLSRSSRNTIAILPLNLIGEASNAKYFAIGLVESLTHMLIKVGNSKQTFSVIPASEIRESITANEARQRFGATIVISGSIQPDGESNRLILNLIDTKNSNLLNSKKLDYQKVNNLIIQDEIISEIVKMLGLEMEPEMQKILIAGGTKSNSANDLYLQGRGLLQESQSVKEIDSAINLFQQSLDEDSLFALAYAGMAQALTVKYHYTYNIKWANESIIYSRKAVQLNDQDPYALISLASALVDRGEYNEAHDLYQRSYNHDSTNDLIYTELGYLYEMEQDYDKAEEYYKKAVSHRPSTFHVYYYLGVFYYFQSRYTEAIEEIKKGLLIAPSNHNLLNVIGACYFVAEEFDDALIVFRQILDNDSTNGVILKNLASVNLYISNFDEAIIFYNKAIKYLPQSWQLLGALGKTYFWSRNTELANQTFQKAIDIARSNLQLNPGISVNIVEYFHLMGETDSANYYLEQSTIKENPKEYSSEEAFSIGEMYLIIGDRPKALLWIESALERDYGWIDVKYSPFFNDLREDEEFKLILSKYDDH